MPDENGSAQSRVMLEEIKMKYVSGKNLTYEYIQYDTDNDKQLKFKALDNVDIDVDEGDFVAVLGHNGSGKSTLAKHINALLRPTSGTLIVKGFDTADESNAWSIRSSAGMVFQNPDNQLIATVVEEDAAFGPENLGIEPEEIRRRVDFALNAVKMTEYKDKSPYQLSGGQKQRVAIAGILAMKPGLIILDEPTAMLDPIGRREVMEAVLKLNREEGITVILVTHFMEEAALADKIIVMQRGSIAMQGTPRYVFSNADRLRQLRLDLPQAAEIAHRLRQKGFPVDEGVLTVNELANELLKIGFNDNAYKPPEKKRGLFKEPLLKVKGLTHIYGSETVFEKVALKNVDLTVYKGEFLGLIGHTGSGKSTLIQHLNALVKPTEGVVMLNGVDINENKATLKKTRQRIGLVFQYPEHQLFEATVYKDVAFAPQNMNLNQQEIDRRVKNALELVGIGKELYEKSPFELSGGQKRRVAIAGILAMEPEVLILDEPTAGLDPYGRDELLGNIKSLQSELNLTVILVSHSMEDIALAADRIVVMYDGCVKYSATPEEVFSHGRELEKIGLSVPQSNKLVRLLKAEGVDVTTDIYTVDTAVDMLEHILKKEKAEK